ncbi:enoyl-CoA hydratase/isomerase family protein [Leisingera aquaemixtae]|uniref:enoyl-CoA hydratase/isomerase family protein n=1 Tax=Leisingera aquaemixtae TaxID=1396826 RepID=UPI001C944B04|nr:enoyl-CoA hydratase/isomerase family protein [Leisingera aquaemixtae]MBY6068522.1 enoyl-CoA hydratase/isomerase family protein [Leisingera aquaemixtae]
MTALVACDKVELQNGEPCFRIALSAPRANALEPGLLTELHEALDALEQSGVQKALIIGGRNFSTGGDIGRFLEAAQAGRAENYADVVVPVLQDLIMRMIEMPVVIASAVRGAATGGAAGILFASDLAAAAPDAFVQPYYGVMGFAPDGGWTALLPELTGAGPAQSWLMANHRFGALELQRLELVQAVDADPETRALALLGGIETESALAAKSMIWNDARLDGVRAGLDAETAAFRKLIGRQETLSRMTEFLHSNG